MINSAHGGKLKQQPATRQLAAMVQPGSFVAVSTAEIAKNAMVAKKSSDAVLKTRMDSGTPNELGRMVPDYHYSFQNSGLSQATR